MNEPFSAKKRMRQAVLLLVIIGCTAIIMVHRFVQLVEMGYFR